MKKALYYIIYSVSYLISLLPLWLLYGLSGFIYLVMFHLIKYRRPLVQKHLQESFPEKSAAELKKIESEFYQWFSDYMVESIKMLSMSKRQMKRRMVFKGTDIVDQIVKEGQSCAVYLGHYCNWEWVTSLPLWVTPEAQCGQIYHVLENSDYDKLFLNLRQRWGAVSIPMAETLRRLVMYRQQKKQVVIGYISDQTPYWNNIHHWLPFLHHDTPVLTGTERLARKLNHAVLYLDVRRLKRGYYEAEFKLITREPKKIQEFEATDIYFQMLEASIRQQPACYLWTHNRWKRTHEEYNLRLNPETGILDITSPLEELLQKKSS